MDLQLTSKRALITGSSIGIGAGIARALAAEGAIVAVHGRERQQAEATARMIAEHGGKAVVVLGDLTHDEDVARLADDAKRQLGAIDILVNNAGGSGPKTAWDAVTAADWAASYDRNVLAIVRLVSHVLPMMRQAKWGRIVNISSAAGQMPPPTGADYGAAKAAVNNLTVSMARAVAEDGVTVNAVSPGTILSPRLEAAFRRMAQDHGWVNGASDAPWAEVERAVLNHAFAVPAGRVGRVEEVAHAVAVLCSPLSGYITGVNLRVDGGMVPTV